MPYGTFFFLPTKKGYACTELLLANKAGYEYEYEIVIHHLICSSQYVTPWPTPVRDGVLYRTRAFKTKYEYCPHGDGCARSDALIVRPIFGPETSASQATAQHGVSHHLQLLRQ